MPQITDIFLRSYFKLRQKKIDAVISDPASFQKRLLKRILDSNANSIYGKGYSFSKIKNYKDYVDAVPLIQYNEIENYIKRMMDGENNSLTESNISWFAKSSGTSNSRSKFIPVSKHYLVNGHLKCAWDAASFIYHEDPTAKLFADKTFIMGGSITPIGTDKFAGDISAIILHHFPKIGRRFYTPDFETALLHDWEEKIKKMATITSKENVTLFAGIPSWSIVLFKEILNQTGKANISEVWPNLKSFLHGGVGFGPYEKVIRTFVPSEKVAFREVYNASEGYFGIQNQKENDGMTLLFDHEIFYEFIPHQKFKSTDSECITLDEVKLNKKYVLVITNSSGLYRYIMDDVIEFVSIAPYKIKVTGRTEQHINVFGEELMVANTDNAIARVCRNHSAQIADYTVAPVFLRNDRNGKHEWLIEFEKEPESISAFQYDLDNELKKLNSDYDAKRSYDLVLEPLEIKVATSGTFERWLRMKGKYGGQNKIKRLSNDRKFMEEIMCFSQIKNPTSII